MTQRVYTKIKHFLSSAIALFGNKLALVSDKAVSPVWITCLYLKPTLSQYQDNLANLEIDVCLKTSLVDGIITMLILILIFELQRKIVVRLPSSYLCHVESESKMHGAM